MMQVSKKLGRWHVYHGVASSILNHLKTSGHRGYEFLVLVLEYDPILAYYRFPAAEEFVVIFDV